MTEDTRVPRGIRNNNPGNIKAFGGIHWRGQRGQDADGFATFSSPRFGLRAIAVIWQDYCYYHKFTTLRQYLDRWAPPSENHTETYLRVLCAAAAVGPDEPYNPCERPLFVLRAIVCMECGYCPYSDTDLQAALDAAHIR